MGTIALRKTPREASRDVAKLVATQIDSAHIERRTPQGFMRSFLMGDGSHVKVAWAVVVSAEEHKRATDAI